MSEKKNAITRAAALSYAIEHCDNPDVAEVLRKMHAQVTKPRKKSDLPTKTQMINNNLAASVLEAMEGHGTEPATTKWICEHVSGILTPQKCTAVVKILVENGQIVKNKEGKTVTYSLA